MKLSSLHLPRADNVLCVIVLFLYICLIYYSVNQDPLKQLPPVLQRYVVDKRGAPGDETVDIEALKQKLYDMNCMRNISNIDKYGPMTTDTPVLLVQVHDDIMRLQFLVLSLSQVRFIHTAMVIFSHSVYDDTVNRLVHSIDFCKVMQIFYPHSLQLHPHKFPGVDVEDCLPGTTIKDCVNRDARLTENKQHWWWKANFVFRNMEWVKTHKALIVFLEENNYVAPDLLHMLRYMQRALLYFPQVEVVSLGRPLTKTVDMGLLVVEPWRPPFAAGLAFNHTIWQKIEAFSGEYCMFNDHSWSYSLYNLLQSFPRGHARMAACATPRVISTQELVNTEVLLKKFVNVFNLPDLFPQKVQAVFLFGRDGMVEQAVEFPPEGKGGWGNLRDQVLCLDPLFNSTDEEKRYDETDNHSDLI